jgi:ferredoxin
MVDLRKLNQCDLDGKCVDVCPTKVVSLRIEPIDAGAPVILDPVESAALRGPGGGLAAFAPKESGTGKVSLTVLRA